MEAGTVSELRRGVETLGSVAHLSAYFVSASAHAQQSFLMIDAARPGP